MNIKTRFHGLHEEDKTILLDVHEHEYNPGSPGLFIETHPGGVLMDAAEVRALRDFLTAWLVRLPVVEAER